MMWNVNANSPEKLAHFQAELNKAPVSKGSWKEDYDELCQHFGIIQCPYILQRNYEFGGTTIFVSNCDLDLASWRASLIAFAAANSDVKCISLHNSSVTVQHFADLIAAVSFVGSLKSFKFEFCTIKDSSESQQSDALRGIFSGACAIEYVSLRGCRFGDNVISPIIFSAMSNINLQAVNLSSNLLTDAFSVELFRTMRLHPFLTSFSLAYNQISDDSIQQFIHTLRGTEVSPDDQKALKAVTSLVNDRNKEIKATNKKKKKGSTDPDIPEISLPERTCQVDGRNMVVNKSISFIDFSSNAISVSSVLALINAYNTPVFESLVAWPTIVCRGILTDPTDRSTALAANSQSSRMSLNLII